MKTIVADWMPVIIFIISLSISAWIGFEIGKHQTRRNAVRAGAGEFYLSEPLAQSPDFRWKTNNVNLEK